MPLKEHTTTYLGDGIYVRFDGYCFVLYTSNGIVETNHIYLEPSHIEALNEFVKRMKESK